MRDGHPDPSWWLRCAEVKKGQQSPTDLCPYCGHARLLHTVEGGCTAHSTLLVGAPFACQCTNRVTGVIYRDAATLHQVTARG